MPLPLRLPTIQNWSCHNCGGCCRQHAIEVTEDERQRITSQGWTPQAGFPADRSLFVPLSPWPWNRRYRLGHQADGACVFLDERGLCRIHARFGESAKPLACRIYPYAFHPAGKSITVGLRFSCPSVVSNQGRPVAEQKPDLKALQRLVVPEGAERMPPPAIWPGQQLDWPDTLKIVDALDELLAEPDTPVTLKLLRTLRLIDLLGQASFEKIRGPRVDELLQILKEAVVAEVPTDLAVLPEPSSTGRMQFRLLAAQYARQDTFADQQASLGNRWRLFRSALRFARGHGLIPRLQEQFAAVAFSDLERPFGPLPPEVHETLTRYFRVKVQGLHFCGPAYYGVPLVEGFYSLALMAPVTLWLARWLAAGAQRTSLSTDDVGHALSIADHHHGYSPAFGQRSFRGRVRMLARLDDISKLIAWYGKER